MNNNFQLKYTSPSLCTRRVEKKLSLTILYTHKSNVKLHQLWLFLMFSNVFEYREKTHTYKIYAPKVIAGGSSLVVEFKFLAANTNSPNTKYTIFA